MRRGLARRGRSSPCCESVSVLTNRVADARAYSSMMVGRNTGMELKATLQLKNMNYSRCTSVQPKAGEI